MPGLLLALLVLVNGSAYRWLDQQYLHLAEWQSLPLLIAVAGLSCILALRLLPPALMGDTPAWLVARFSGRLPAKVRAHLQGYSALAAAFDGTYDEDEEDRHD